MIILNLKSFIKIKKNTLWKNAYNKKIIYIISSNQLNKIHTPKSYWKSNQINHSEKEKNQRISTNSLKKISTRKNQNTIVETKKRMLRRKAIEKEI